MVNMAYFREPNPNYAKPSINNHKKESLLNNG